MTITRSRFRPLTIILALVALVLAAFAAATSSPATAQAGPAVTVTPDSGLNGGDVVTVDASGFSPGRRVFAYQCISGAMGAQDCNSEIIPLTIGEDGTVTTKLTVIEGTLGSGTCDAENDCEVHVAEIPPIPGAESAFAVISFAPDEQPTDEPTEEPTDEPTEEPTDEPTEEPDDLADTGVDLGLVLPLASVLLLAGLALVVANRRRIDG